MSVTSRKTIGTLVVGQFNDLTLPDGTRAATLRWRPLHAELCRLCVPGITGEMGKQALLERYAEHVERQVLHDLQKVNPEAARREAAKAGIDLGDANG